MLKSQALTHNFCSLHECYSSTHTLYTLVNITYTSVNKFYNHAIVSEHTVPLHLKIIIFF